MALTLCTVGTVARMSYTHQTTICRNKWLTGNTRPLRREKPSLRILIWPIAEIAILQTQGGHIVGSFLLSSFSFFHPIFHGFNYTQLICSLSLSLSLSLSPTVLPPAILLSLHVCVRVCMLPRPRVSACVCVCVNSVETYNTVTLTCRKERDSEWESERMRE